MAEKPDEQVQKEVEELFNALLKSYTDEVENADPDADESDIFRGWVIEKLARVYALARN